MSLRSHSKRAGASLCLILAGLAPTLAAEPADDAALFQSLQQQVQKLHEKCGAAIIRVEAMDKHGQLSGTGFFIDPNGLLYTSYSLGGDTAEIVAILGEMKYPARRLGADARSGIARLQ